MADDKKGKLKLVDLAGIGNMLEELVAKDLLSCDERDRVLRRIAQEHNFTDVNLSVLTGYGRSIEEVLERSKRRKPFEKSPGRNKFDENYVSLTELVQAHSEQLPGYVIQSWLRSGDTLAFLNLWEKENNPSYCEDAYAALLKKKKAASFTLTPKLWIEQTNAIGIVSKQGKFGGTFAHPIIACEFASWLTPEFKMMMLKLSLVREQLR